MDKLGEALLRLEEAVTRLEAALDPPSGPPAAETRRELAAEIARHLDTALARINKALGED